MAFWKRAATSETATRAEAVARPAEAKPEAETRASFSGPVLSSDANLIQFFGLPGGVTQEVVTLEAALKVPAVFCAVSFLSRTLASLPFKVYRKTDKGREAVTDSPVAPLLSWAANDETSAFDFRRSFWQEVFLSGRGLAFIERNGRGVPINLWPLDASAMSVERRAGRTLYHYMDGTRRVTYAASEVLDLSFMPGSNRLASRSPIYSHADTIGLALAVTRYGARFFDNGGIPPFVVTGPIKTAGAASRASEDLSEAVIAAATGGKNAIALPEGHTLKELGLDPEKMQMVEVKRFLVEEIARIYSMPPVFLQDLTHGTFSNTEQQDLHLVKHLVSQWATAFEAEANLKLFGRAPGGVYAEHSLAGLMRGDLKARAEAIAQQINTGQLTINEARELDNREAVPGGELPLVQGAMVPATMAGAHVSAAPAPQSTKGADDE